MTLFLRAASFAALLAAGAQCSVISRLPDTEEHESIHVRSLLDPSVSLSYKQAARTTSTFHSFFWFFEARNNPQQAPLSLWLQGGPGAPSTQAAVGDNGPCQVARNSRDTVLSPWSWNNEVNMLYFDQPVQTGHSYDTLINGTVDETQLPFVVTPVPPGSPIPELNTTFLLGTFPSQNPTATANTTSTAALAAWHFMQIWMQEFPAEYTPSDNTFSIWSASYGGDYGPGFANFFTEQSKKIADGTIGNGAIPFRIDTVGIINGCVDILEQILAYPQMAYNNTYGIQVITEAEYNTAVNTFPACRSQVEACRALVAAQDPTGLGNVPEVNQACSDAYYFCIGTMTAGVESRGRDVYDIVAMVPNSFPPRYVGGYLNSEEVQLALGVPLNMSGLSTAANIAFMSTGDFVFSDSLLALGELLDQGVKVALVYGDRDYQCNWYGGEQVSVAIESKFSNGFHEAGYAEIQTNGTYIGGLVRQYGNLSFSRVFDAGHAASWYQPETAYQIFMRAMFNKDIATGQVSTAKPCGKQYSTTGPETVFDVTNPIPSHPETECYLWAIFLTCTEVQTEMLRNGTAILEDFIMIGLEDDGTIHYY